MHLKMRKLEEHFRTDDHFGKNVSCKAQMQPGTLPPETNSGKKHLILLKTGACQPSIVTLKFTLKSSKRWYAVCKTPASLNYTIRLFAFCSEITFLYGMAVWWHALI